MYKSIDLLNEVKAKYSLTSNYQLARKLDLTDSSVSGIMNKKNFLGTRNAYKVAELLLLHPLRVIASTEYERADRLDDDTMREFWKRIYEENNG